jgi:hypothetical protein
MEEQFLGMVAGMCLHCFEVLRNEHILVVAARVPVDESVLEPIQFQSMGFYQHCDVFEL